MFSKIKDIWHHKHDYFGLLSHWGLKYKCPICGFHSKNLNPIGIDNSAIRKYQIIGAGKRNAGCPKCGSSDRDRLVYAYLKHETNVLDKPTTRILHIAPEMVIANKFIEKKFTHYLCGDFFAEGQHDNYSRELVKHIDVQNLPFSENSFDLIICNHVLEHVFDENKAIAEIYRVLNKDGFAILQVPISPFLKETISDPSITDEKKMEEKFGQKDHVRLFGMDYVTKLESCKFIVKTLKLHQKYPKFGLNPKEILFIVKKQND